MTCKQFRELIHDLARDQALDPAAVRSALAHAESCGACDALLEETESLTAALRGLAQRHSREEAPARVEAAVLAAFRQQFVADSRVRDSRAKHSDRTHATNLRFFALAGAMGIAAAILLVIFLARNASRNAPVERSQPHMAPVERSPDRFGGAPNPRDVQSASAAGEEDPANAFVPLSESLDPSSLEDGTVVRVVLSPAALASLGFPIVDDQDTGNVTADLLLAQDGTPEAIRLLDDNESDQSVGIYADLQ